MSKHLICALAGAAAALAFTGAAFAVDASKLALPGDLTLAQAQKVVAAAEAKAQQQGTLMNIAVIDAGGNLKAFARMDGAFLGSIDISLKKAKTAREFNMSSKELGDLAQPGKLLYGIEVMSGRRPLSRDFLRLCECLGCGHVYGLFCRKDRPAGPDVSSAAALRPITNSR